MNNIFKVILFSFFFSPSLYSQYFGNKDLKTIKVDLLSASEIAQAKAQLKSQNLTIEQAKPLLLTKGLPEVEYNKLVPLLKEETVNTPEKKEGNTTLKKEENIVPKKNNITNSTSVYSDSKIFGSELFDNPNLNFEPNLNLATPLNYILGPGDELQISVYGVQEFNSSAKVSAEGKITIQFVGQITVSGITIEAATQKIKNSISKVYSTVNSGQSQISVSLSQIRTIKVTIIGGRQPGNYSISSLSTVYNALHTAGGPGDNGTYRNIQLIRNNKIIKIIDIYNFLKNGDQSDNIGLKDNDVVRIPIYTNRVTIEGQVKRPGLYELKENESFVDLINYASGFNSTAYTASVNVTQITNKEYKIIDILESQFNSYIPKTGDLFKVSEILHRFENRIQINGAVLRPNTYAFHEGMRVSQLIKMADGLREDVYLNRARIIRVKKDMTTELININLNGIITEDTLSDILLYKEDIITIYSILEFKELYKISITGEVQKPGQYEFIENLTLNDLLIQAGGLTSLASKKIEISRMIKSDIIDNTKLNKVELFNLEINPENNEQVDNFKLQPFDIITIHQMAVVEKPEYITVQGAVVYPGVYILSLKNEKVSEIIKRTGGLKIDANIDGVKIKRVVKTEENKALTDVNLNKDLNIEKSVSKSYLTIPLNLDEILKHPNRNSNIPLLPGDILEITFKNECIKVRGNVLLNSEIPFNKGKGVKYYINAVGGGDSKAWIRKAYIIYPNGRADAVKTFLGIRIYPKVKAGCQIIVPEKPEKSKKNTTGEIIGYSSIITSLAGVVIAILKI